MLKVRDLPEKVKALVNLLLRPFFQTLRSEAFHCKRTHHAAIKHSRTKHRRRQFRLRSNIAIETSGERIARPRRIDSFGQRQRRRTKWTREFRIGERPATEERSRAVFAMLHHKCLWPNAKYFFRRYDNIALAGE